LDARGSAALSRRQPVELRIVLMNDEQARQRIGAADAIVARPRAGHVQEAVRLVGIHEHYGRTFVVQKCAQLAAERHHLLGVSERIIAAGAATRAGVGLGIGRLGVRVGFVARLRIGLRRSIRIGLGVGFFARLGVGVRGWRTVALATGAAAAAAVGIEVVLIV